MASKRKALDASAAPPAKQEQQQQKESKVIHFTARNPPWSYLKLQLIPQPGYPSTTSTPLDELTTRTYLSSALSQFLGVTGTAISIDILKIENDDPNKYAWIRVPRDDASAVVSAVSSWIGGSKTSGGSGTNAGNVAWRVCAKGNFLGALVNGSGADLFAP